MAKMELEPRAEFSPIELLRNYRSGDKSPQDIITLVKKLGLDDPDFFKSEKAKILRRKHNIYPDRLKELKNDYYDAMGKLNLVTTEKDILPAQDGYKTKEYEFSKQPGSRKIKEEGEGSRPSVQLNTPDTTILDGDDEKKTFFQKLFSKENRPFLENLGMQLGTNLTAPMNPGENRSLINQVATSIQGASDKTAAQETADVTKLLNAAKAKKALSEADGGTDLYKKAVEYVTSLYPNIKSTDPAYGKYLAQAMNKFGVKDITTAQVNAFVKLSQMESELGMLLDKDSDEYKKKALEIDAFKKRLNEGGIGASSGDGRKIVTFEDSQGED